MPAPPLGSTGTTTHPGDRQTVPQPFRSPALSHSFCCLSWATCGSSRSRLRASPPRLNVAPMLFDEPKNCPGRRGIVGIEGHLVGIEGKLPVLNAERSVDIRGFFDAERKCPRGKQARSRSTNRRRAGSPPFKVLRKLSGLQASSHPRRGRKRSPATASSVLRDEKRCVPRENR